MFPSSNRVADWIFARQEFPNEGFVDDHDVVLILFGLCQIGLFEQASGNQPQPKDAEELRIHMRDVGQRQRVTGRFGMARDREASQLDLMQRQIVHRGGQR